MNNDVFDEDEEVCLEEMQLQVINALTVQKGKLLKLAKTYPKITKDNTTNPKTKGVWFVNIEVNGQLEKSLVDTNASHYFINLDKAKRLGLRINTRDGMLKVTNGNAKLTEGMSWAMKTKIDTWQGMLDFLIVPLEYWMIT